VRRLPQVLYLRRMQKMRTTRREHVQGLRAMWRLRPRRRLRLLGLVRRSGWTRWPRRL